MAGSSELIASGVKNSGVWSILFEEMELFPTELRGCGS